MTEILAFIATLDFKAPLNTTNAEPITLNIKV